MGYSCKTRSYFQGQVTDFLVTLNNAPRKSRVDLSRFYIFGVNVIFRGGPRLVDSLGQERDMKCPFRQMERLIPYPFVERSMWFAHRRTLSMQLNILIGKVTRCEEVLLISVNSLGAATST